MRVEFTARHFKTSQRLKEFATEEVRRLKKYYDGILDVEIILDYVKQQQIAEIIVIVYGQTLKAIEKTDDMYKSISLAVDKLERQIRKYKAKIRHFEKERISENIEIEEE